MKVQDQHKIKPETQSCQTSVTSSCGSIKMSLENNEKLFERLEDESISIILIDPPYKYLKNQKLEVDFDENIFFNNCKRVLKKDGFIILFGRGVSFYRMNIILDSLDFIFKEEIIWDKTQNSSPVMKISRVHETCSIFSKGNGIIRESRIPYEEMKALDFESIIQDLKRIKSGLANAKSLDALINYVKNESIDYGQSKTRKHHATVQGILKEQDRAVKALQSITQGMKEKSIIKIGRDHYNTIHPTQKPVRLLERILMICLPESPKKEIIVADFFGGSMSTMEAVYNLGLNGIACEIDNEYFESGKNRILELTSQQRMFL